MSNKKVTFAEKEKEDKKKGRADPSIFHNKPTSKGFFEQKQLDMDIEKALRERDDEDLGWGDPFAETRKINKKKDDSAGFYSESSGEEDEPERLKALEAFRRRYPPSLLSSNDETISLEEYRRPPSSSSLAPRSSSLDPRSANMSGIDVATAQANLDAFLASDPKDDDDDDDNTLAELDKAVADAIARAKKGGRKTKKRKSKTKITRKKSKKNKKVVSQKSRRNKKK